MRSTFTEKSLSQHKFPMASTQLKQTQKPEEDGLTLFPMSPSSQSVHSSIISLTILCAVELETELDEFETTKIIRDVFLPLNARFSSIIDMDEKGKPCWKKVQVIVEDHVRVPSFSNGLTRNEYDTKVKEYLATIPGVPLAQNRPLWEIHLIKYPTMNGAVTLVFKLSHALGDGYSIMSILLRAFKRANDPSLPLTLPKISTRATGGNKSLSGYVSMFMNTVSDLTFTVLKGSVLEDSKNVIRSGTTGVEFEPIAIADISVPLDGLKLAKTRTAGTLNDVITGAIYYTIHLYMAKKGGVSNGRKLSLLVMFNMRMLKCKSIDEMIKANIWGNHVGLLLAPIPRIDGEKEVDPLDFVVKAKEIMDRRKNSMLPHLTNPIISVLRWIRGPKGVSEFLHASFRNTTATITSLVGPKEKMALAGHPVGSYYFLVAGIPQSLVFTVASCTGHLRVTAAMEKKLIDPKLFKSCMEEAFEKIHAAVTASSGGRVLRGV